jgi:hypothetical protein
MRKPSNQPGPPHEDACYSSLVESNRVTSNPLELNRALGSRYGGRNTNRPRHNGIDIRAARGDKVFTRVAGRVGRLDVRRHGTNPYNEDTGFGTTYPANGTYAVLSHRPVQERV